MAGKQRDQGLEEADLPPKPPPTGIGTIRSSPGSRPRMFAVACRVVNIPWVGVHTVRPPSGSGRATTTWGSIVAWWTEPLS